MEHLGVLKRSMAAGQQVQGCWIDLFSSMATEIIAQAGYDCVIIDMEHGPGSFMDSLAQIQAVKGSACTPIIRVPSNDEVQIKRALDIGAAGVMIPGVEGARDAERAVAACHYPPAGRRGLAPSIVRAADYGAEALNYYANVNDLLLTICQIETERTMVEISEVAAIPGLDLLFVGPNDLAAALGVPGEPSHPKVDAALDQVCEAAKQCGKLCGTIPTQSRPAEALLSSGYDMVIAGSDTGMLRDTARQSVASLKAVMKKV